MLSTRSRDLILVLSAMRATCDGRTEDRHASVNKAIPSGRGGSAHQLFFHVRLNIDKHLSPNVWVLSIVTEIASLNCTPWEWNLIFVAMEAKHVVMDTIMNQLILNDGLDWDGSRILYLIQNLIHIRLWNLP